MTDFWAPPWPAVVLGAAGALGLGAWAVAATDPPGRLLTGLAALALALAAAFGALARPRLRADDDGLALRGLSGRRAWPWARVDAVRAVRMRRMGLPAAYLEVEVRDDGEDAHDGGERLLVLGRLELGTDPVEVAGALQDHRARAGRRSSGRLSGDRRSGERERPDGDEDDQEHDDPADGEEPGRGA
ncbi:PH (Pleckstrin Homology) domain-containing protein [Actinomycetospora succinea]|uniref:PH (Pleckstrin Homology) domain-containing protein n=1 Tax=Actinomycetospora succinea TaxID=663603 RepID=A0A4R6VDQ6_9PSEU|nr:PH domain-containing protein [Actinomycetospora succinea]TDQ60882.1 PH (Pleckstrin Homology) domain-containing protein [Actinomycetospora succinea]